ncbi:MAG: pentapeptide repeat-containing protein [Candidatus Nanopelagicales bacterium]|nr:pentapeptide repeat-containing protein [Candidatus Nanopelagicales bacterium]
MILSNANLTGATLANTDLSGVTLTGATWSNTTCPDGYVTNNGC